MDKVNKTAKFELGQIIRHCSYDFKNHEDYRGIVIKIQSQVNNGAITSYTYDIRWISPSGAVGDKTINHEEFELMVFKPKLSKRSLGFSPSV